MQLHVRMVGRDPEQTHRAATPLELFFDLTFVVAVAQGAEGLHHGLVEGHAGDVLPVYPLVFFGIWWAWMNFTWFASAFDTDDAVYRLAILVQLTGVLVLAAGIPRAFEHQDFGVATLGYVIMRLAIVAQWLRAAASHPDGRRCTLRYGLGIAAIQIFWVLRLALPDGPGMLAFVALAAVELAIPYWAEGAGRTPWHPGHIAERYGLFTLIVLGESVLAATVGVQVALDTTSTFGDLAPVIVGGILTVFSMWWLYFDMPAEQVVVRARAVFTGRARGAFLWGYGHFVVFASAAAAGAGVAVAVDQATHHSKLTDTQAGFAVTVPVTVYLLAVWTLHYATKAPGPMRNYAVPTAGVLILAASFTPQPVLVTGLLLGGLVAVGVIAHCLEPAPVAAQVGCTAGEGCGVTIVNLRLALRALASTRLRTTLTLLGVLIGTAAVILLVGVVTGSRSLLQRRMDALGTKAVWILPNENPDNEAGTRSRFTQLRPADVEALRDPDRAPTSWPSSRWPGRRVTLTWEDVSYTPADFAATPPGLAPIYNVKLSSGVFYNEADEADHAKVAVLGSEVVDHLFDKSVEPVGQKITINNVAFKVVGVMARKGTIATYNQDDIVFVPLSTGIDQITGHVDSFGVLGILAGSPEQVPAVRSQVDTVLRQTHGLGPTDSPDYQTFTAADLVRSTDSVSGQFNQLLLAVALISLTIGGIGVMNIMLVSVTERTHEIGIRKALGAQRHDIRSQFLVEAVVVTLIGGLLGIVAGLAATSYRLGEIRPEGSLAAVVAALGVSVAVGVLSGVYPAERAARMTPIDALRWE